MRGSRAVVGFNVESTVLRDTAEPRCERKPPVEHLIPLHIEKLPEGVCLATSADLHSRLIEFASELADDVTLVEALEELQILAALTEAQSDSAAGRVVTHEEASRRMESWITE